MTTLNRTLSTAVRNVDPRIDSPQVQVVYPSVTMAVKDATSTVSTGSTASTSSVTTHAPALPLFQPEDKVIDNSTVVESQPKSDVPTPKTWVDVLKQNATLFIVVGLISVVVGIFIGKKL